MVNSIENTQSADAGEVKTREPLEDDVPLEYTQRPPDEPKE